jgi:hypothetical protein
MVGPAGLTFSHFFNSLEKVGHFSDPLDRVVSRFGGPPDPLPYEAIGRSPALGLHGLGLNRFKGFWRD